MQSCVGKATGENTCEQVRASKRKNRMKMYRHLLAAALPLLLLEPAYAQASVFKPAASFTGAQAAAIRQDLHMIAEVSSKLFIARWRNRESASKAIVAEAERLMVENHKRKYKLGEWDCALFTYEAYNRAISIQFLSVLAQVDPDTNYKVAADIGKTTYGQWNSTKMVIEKKRKPELIRSLGDENIGDLIFHRQVLGEVASPTPKEKYGHVAIYLGKRHGVHYAIANSSRKKHSGVMERPLSKMFKAKKIDGGREPLLFASRPEFNNFEILDNGTSIILSTGGKYPIKIEISRAQ